MEVSHRARGHDPPLEKVTAPQRLSVPEHRDQGDRTCSTDDPDGGGGPVPDEPTTDRAAHLEDVADYEPSAR